MASPSPIRRPLGIAYETGTTDEAASHYRPTTKLDYELEVGYFVSKPIPYGQALPIEDAPEHIFGLVLLNDWSSRDVQAFEMRPLGPFHSKGMSSRPSIC